MYAKTSHVIRIAGLLAGSLVALTLSARAEETASANSDAFPVFDNNYIKVSGQGNSIRDNEAAFQSHTQNAKGGSGGIEDLRIGRDLGNGLNVQMNGKLLTQAADYLGQITITKDDFGSVDVGYKRFRTFYDGVGGFFPLNNAMTTLPNEYLHTDRAKFWATVKIERPDKPVFTFKYTNELRNGQKDSTIWGDSDLTGVTVYSNSKFNITPYNSSNRRIIPALMNLDERQQNFEATMTQTAGNTTVLVSLFGNWIKNDDLRTVNRYPGEVKPYVAIPSSPLTVIPGSALNNPMWGFDEQKNKVNTLGFMTKVETQINDKMSAFAGLKYQDGNGSIYGYRVINTIVPTKVGNVTAPGGFATNGRPPYSYQTVDGVIKYETLAANAGVNMKPAKDLFVDFAVKGEQRFNKGYNIVNFIDTYVNTLTGATNSVPVYAPNDSRLKETAWTPELDVRYVGIERVSLYGTVDYRYAPGSERTSSVGVSPKGVFVVPSYAGGTDNISENHAHYKVGANWVVSSAVTLRAETFYKDHRNDFTDALTSNGQFLLGYEFYGASLSAIVKVLPTVTMTTRYIGQIGQMNVTTDTTAKYQSADSKNHLFGETIDWNPSAQFYMQGNLNVVFDTTSTSYPRAGGVMNYYLQNADENYVNGSVIAGFVVDKDTDAQIEGTFYRADNYNSSVAFATLPYGAGVKEYTVTVGVKHKLSPKLVAEAKVGYVFSDNDTTGGFTNYKGALGYVGITQSF